MLVVPLKPVPNQNLTVTLGNQVCQITIFQSFYGVFMNLYVNNTLIVAGVLCENMNRIVRSAYLGFIGDFTFVDTQGDLQPYYTGLGDRYQLCYLEETDLP